MEETLEVALFDEVEGKLSDKARGCLHMDFLVLDAHHDYPEGVCVVDLLTILQFHLALDHLVDDLAYSVSE